MHLWFCQSLFVDWSIRSVAATHRRVCCLTFLRKSDLLDKNKNNTPSTNLAFIKFQVFLWCFQKNLQLVEPLPADFTILSLIVRSMSTFEEFHGATSWRADMHTRGIPFESWSRHAYTSPMPIITWASPLLQSCPQQWNERVLRHMSVHLQC